MCSPLSSPLLFSPPLNCSIRFAHLWTWRQRQHSSYPLSLSSCPLAVPPAWLLTPSPLPVQHDLKAARAEAARKGRLLAAAEGEAKQRAAAVAAEAEARTALEAEVGRARLVAARQAAVVKELHRKLEAAQGVDRDASAELQRAQAAEEKVRTLTAALTRKDGALKELRAQAHAGGRDAGAAAAAAQEKEGLEAAVRKWQGEAARRWATRNRAYGPVQPSLLRLTMHVRNEEGRLRHGAHF
jgi:hypothetical protein